jgi:O-antigen/teichoic acid export membrane protein
VRRADFTSVSLALVEQGAGRAAVSIALGWWQAGWIGLVLGEIAGRSLGIGRMIRRAWPAIKQVMGHPDRKYYSLTLKNNWKFPAVVLPSSLIDALAAMLPLPVVSYLFGAATAGQFFLVERLINLPGGFISGSVGDVFHAHLTENFRNDPAKTREVLRHTASRLGMVAFLIYVPIGVVSPFMFSTVFGKEWFQAGILVSILSPVALVGMVVSPVSRLLWVVNRSELKLVVDVLRILVPLVSIFGMYFAGYGFWACMIAFGLLQLFSYLIYFYLIWVASDAAGILSTEH